VPPIDRSRSWSLFGKAIYESFIENKRARCRVMHRAGFAGRNAGRQSRRGGTCIPGLSCDKVSAITFMVATEVWLRPEYPVISRRTRSPSL
jgi:hypothetical protein